MEKNVKVKKPHFIAMEGRHTLNLGGVERVVSSSETQVVLVTSEGGLSVLGKGLKLEKFSVEDGSMTLVGSVDCIKYSAAKISLLRRIFR